MQVDLSESRSKAFNIFLRFIQLGIALLVAIIVVHFYSVHCSTTFYTTIIVSSIALLLISLISNICFRCREGFNKTLFFVLLIICTVLTGIMLVVSFVGFGQSNVCASNRVTYRFMLIYILAIIVVNGMILFGPFFWVQRYSNSPGNVVWIFMFLLFSWNPAYTTLMTVIAIIAIIISLLTLTINLIVALTGITTTIKRAVSICWAIGMILMLVNEVIAIAAYIENSKYSSYKDMEAKKVLLFFVILNIVELVFWGFGLYTLRTENGDMVRDSLLNQGFSAGDEEHYGQEEAGGIGTLK